MSIDYSELAAWFSERPTWLQDAARRLFHAGDLSPDDLTELIVLCKREADIPVHGHPDIVAKPITAAALNVSGVGVPLRLDSLSAIKAINALAPRNPLNFGKQHLTVIFGSNGSGKSGYIRILKHVCGGRGLRTLHRNVFQPTDAEQSCTVAYTHGAEAKTLFWKADDDSHPDLRSVSLFDSDCANVYINEENQIAYEPTLLCYFRRLVEVCEHINTALRAEADSKTPTKPLLPVEHAQSAAGRWYGGLTHSVTDVAIDSHCLWNSDLDAEVAVLDQRVKETNPTEKAKAIRKTKGYVQEVRRLLEELDAMTNDDSLVAILAARNDATTKRRAADDAAQKVFEKVPLPGVASESWQLLWEKARVYSEAVAYPGGSFPVVDVNARCVLCHQVLDSDAKTRLSDFQSFVTGTLESDAKVAETTLKNKLAAIKDVLLDTELDAKLDTAMLSDEALRASLRERFRQLKVRRDAVLIAKTAGDVQPLPQSTVVQGLKDIESNHEAAALAFDEDAKKDSKKELAEKLRELRAQKWLSEQKGAVQTEIIRLNEIAALAKAQRLTNTQALSTKKTSLSEQLITAEFVKRFEDELHELGASHLKVTIEKTRTTKGQVWHRVALKDCALEVTMAQVLSEGELRVVSIAAFLADVAINQDNASFIFDDPISSLDQDYEEYTAYRLAKMSKTRQVIVFTHRLSLLYLVQTAAEQTGVDCTVVSLQREEWGAGEPGEPPLPAQKPAQALNSLLGERLAKAKRIHAESGKAEYHIYAKALCSDTRITIERLVEHELMADVVQRFRRPITTMGKIEKLAKISAEDCKLFDDLMTKYSRYEHAQPNEAPVPLPEPTDIETDLKRLKSWLDAFKARPVPVAV